MKDLKAYLTEGKTYTPSFEEVQDDIDKVRRAYTKAEKQAIADKYGITSLKMDDIERGIREIFNNQHKNKKPNQYTDEDFKNWWSMFNGPTTAQVLKKALEGESVEWCKFVLDKAQELVFNGKRGDFWARAQRSFEKYVGGLVNKDKNSKDVGLQALLAKLFEQTKDFHDEYIERVREWHEQYFDKYYQMKDFDIYDLMCFFGVCDRDNVAKCYDRGSYYQEGRYNIYKTYKDLSNYFEPLSEEYISEKKTIEFNGKTLRAEPIRKKIRIENTRDEESLHNPKLYSDIPGKDTIRQYKRVNELKAIYKWNRKEYVDKNVEEAEKRYKYDIEAIAEKVRRMNMDEEFIEVLSIDSDPKHYDIVLSDGKKKVHARSIFAAEFSYLVAPHYRFIIT